MVVGKSNDMQCHNCVGETVPNQTTQHDLIYLNSAIVHFAKIPVNSSLQIDPNKSSNAFPGWEAVCFTLADAYWPPLNWVDCGNVKPLIASPDMHAYILHWPLQETHYRSTLISPITSQRNQLVNGNCPPVQCRLGCIEVYFGSLPAPHQSTVQLTNYRESNGSGWGEAPCLIEKNMLHIPCPIETETVGQLQIHYRGHK